MVEINRREIRDLRRELKRLRMAELKRRRVIEFTGLLADRRDDFIALMSGVAAPKARDAVDDLTAIGREVMHVLGARNETRRRLEGAVRRKRHPPGCEVIGNGGRYVAHELCPILSGVRRSAARVSIQSFGVC